METDTCHDAACCMLDKKSLRDAQEVSHHFRASPSTSITVRPGGGICSKSIIKNNLSSSPALSFTDFEAAPTNELESQTKEKNMKGNLLSI